jgi:hypothetical protein
LITSIGTRSSTVEVSRLKTGLIPVIIVMSSRAYIQEIWGNQLINLIYRWGNNSSDVVFTSSHPTELNSPKLLAQPRLNAGF